MTTSFDSAPTPNTTPMLSTSQVLSSPNPNQPLPSSQIQPFPSPQTFTFLPQLYTLISRLAPLQSSHQQPSHSQSQTNGTPATNSRASRSPTLTRRPGTSAGSTDHQQPQLPSDSAASGAPLTLTQTHSKDDTIEIKDLPALVYPLRQQIERAREVVRELPDVERGVEEQEVEIRELEGRIRGLKGRLAVLGGLAAGATGGSDGGSRGVEGDSGGKEDTVMQGVEG